MSDLRADLAALMRLPGLSGHEDRVRRAIRDRLKALGLATRTDALGNLSATLAGDAGLPSVLVMTHMDQLGFVVSRIEPSGLIRLARLGGVPDRALLSQAVLVCVGEGRDVPGVIGCKSHHATGPEEKGRVPATSDLAVDAGFASAAEASAAGVRIGTPVTYQPRVIQLAGGRVAGTSVDDRAGCAVLVDLARRLAGRTGGPTVHLLFSVQEEFSLKAAVPAARALAPAIAMQIDILLATDTPEMAGTGEVALGGGPGISLYAFHGRGTLAGVIPHPSLVRLFETAADRAGLPLQRSARVGVLTDLSYAQLVGEGVAAIDVGFPLRYSHSSLEVCDPADLEGLSTLLETALGGIDSGFTLDRDAVT
jgi:putative aminopeptidase FrvX